MSNPRKLRVIVIDEETGNELINEVSHEVQYNLRNDLYDIAGSCNSMLRGPMVSRGTYLNLHCYFTNKNYKKDMEEALKEMG